MLTSDVADLSDLRLLASDFSRQKGLPQQTPRYVATYSWIDSI